MKKAIWFDYQDMPQDIKNAYKKCIGSRANDSFIEWYWDENCTTEAEQAGQLVQDWFISQGYILPHCTKMEEILVKYWW